MSEARTQPDHTSGLPDARRAPSFLIVGTSRSGTTLIEQVFASHPHVPVELRMFWSATLMHKFVIPQMVTRHYWNDPATPAVWNFNGWMIGAA